MQVYTLFVFVPLALLFAHSMRFLSDILIYPLSLIGTYVGTQEDRRLESKYRPPGISPEHAASIHASHGISLPLSNMSILDVKATFLVKFLLPSGADDRCADAGLLIDFHEPGLNEHPADASALPVRMDDQRLEIPRFGTVPGPAVLDVGVGALQDVLSFGVCGSVGPDVGGQMHGG